ncbi:MAG TPA: LLM class F420-dependent oxidoreductase, partial [Candidatus Tectomicrobia bacterium]
MEFGICVPHYGKPVDIASTLGVARSAEELGFASVWVTDHLFVPRTMEIIYRDNMLEPLALLSHLAAVVSRVRLGTSVLILPYRNPIIVAKMLATIDQLSHGRLIFGAAVGWMEEEFHALKVPFAERGALSDESLRIIRAHWSGGVVDHQGTFYRYSDMQASPRPVQQPGPPIWIGGNSARARRRVAALGDGWHSSSLNAAAMAPGCAHVRELWEKHGRQGQPVFSARTDLTIEGISDRVLS